MTAAEYRIRVMRSDEAETAVGWARAEGWNPGLADLDAFLPTDREGFLAGALDGRMIASISAVRYGPEYGFIGFYIVDKPWRGRGYGIRLWRAGIERLAGVACVGLDGVLAEEPSYRKSGFVSAYRNRRYGGGPPDVSRGAAGLVDARSVPIGELAALDRTMFPAQRRGFLAAWVSLPGHRALAVAVDGRVAGFGVARPCVQGFKLGPLYAEDRAMAGRLIAGLCMGMGKGPAFLDVPEVNREAVALAQSLGWSVSFETARMYRGPAPPVDTARLYGVASFELG
jgi:GNAT superfamily N-acetyltransferase